MTDAELLAAYVKDHSQDAFGALIERHAGLVYAAAIRQVRDPGLAQDVVQGVFMALASKAPSLVTKAATLPGWLLIATRYGARNLLRSRAARMHHEQEATAMKSTSISAVDSEKLFSLLDNALSRLSSVDRTVVALYYFENQSMRDVGNALTVSEDAAQMRVSRALARLRKILTRAGITSSADAIEESLYRQGAIAPPTALVIAVASNVLHPATAASGGSVVAKGILQSLFIKKAAVAAAFTVGVSAAAAIPTVPLVYHLLSGGSNQAPPASPMVTDAYGVAPVATLVPGAVSVPADSTFSITLPNGISIELLGLMDNSTQQSWAPDGSPLPSPLQTASGTQWINLNANPGVIERGIKWSAHLNLPPKLASDIVFEDNLNVGNGGATNEDSNQNGTMITQLTPVPQSKTTGTIHFDFATGKWQTIVATDGTQTVSGGINGVGNFTLQPAVNDKGNLSVTLIQKNIQPDFYTNYTYWLVARTNNGKLIYPNGSTGNNDRTTFSFNISLDQIETIEFQIKRFDLFVEFQNVSLYPRKHTNVQIDSWQNIN